MSFDSAKTPFQSWYDGKLQVRPDKGVVGALNLSQGIYDQYYGASEGGGEGEGGGEESSEEEPESEEHDACEDVRRY